MLAPVIRRDQSIKLSPTGLQAERESSNGRMNKVARSTLAAAQERFALPTPQTLEAAAKVNRELNRCRYPVGKIKCECTADSLFLTGVTSQYYYVQIALETALRHAGQTPVRLNVVVANQV